MASNDGEHRMLFDIRGKRRHVVKVVYAVLAVLMGASLFLVVGPLNVGELFNSDSASNSEAAKSFEEQADRIEAKLKKDPDDANLLLALTRARITAGNTLTEVSPTGQRTISEEGYQHYLKASQTWDEYLKATDEPSPGLAQLTAPMFFTLAETSGGNEIEANIEAAAQAQRIVAKQRPNLNSLSTLAIYTMFTFDYEGAEKAGAEAQKFAQTKFERENVENELKETRQRAEEFEQRVKAYERQVKKVQAAGGGGAAPEALENPFGGLGGGGGPGE
jgi:hypothetical protein